jgi:hypothetical protein
MDADVEPAMAPEERAASLAAFELRWPFPESAWRVSRTEIRPDHASYRAARAAVEGGRRVVTIAGTATMEIAGERWSGPGEITLLLRPDSFAPRERWVMGGGRWAI